MAGSAILNRLASGISLEERHELLEKLKEQSIISTEPLYAGEPEQGSALETGEQYRRLSWFYRFWFFLISLFKSKTPVQLFEDRQVAGLGRQIEAISPGIYDYQKGRLLPAFYNQIEKLRDAARFFYTALDAGFSRDKGAFYSFLGSLEMGHIHSRLLKEADPTLLGEKHPDASELELRRMALQSMENILEDISDEFRNIMYFDARSLFCLKELCSFLFDRLLKTFSYDTMVNGYTCSVKVIKDLLSTLNNILCSIKLIPPMTLMESLFVFLTQDQAGDPGFDINEEIQSFSTRAEEALTVIREFNKSIPLAKILRCANKNVAVVTREISGGEDWFAVYREYWKRHIEILFNEYMQGRRRRELLASFGPFLKGMNLKPLGNVLSDINPEGIPVKGAFGLSFLQAFYSVVFTEDINGILKPILINGNFKLKETRSEFAEAYNDFVRLEDLIGGFEKKISAIGDFGKRYAQARQEITSFQIKRRKTQNVIDEASAEALRIVEATRRASRNMINVLKSIINDPSKEKNEILINLPEIISVKGPEFMNSIADTIQRLQALSQILDNIDAVDMDH